MVVRTLSKTSILAFMVAGLISVLLGSHLQLKAKLRLLLVPVTVLALTYGFTSQYLSTYLDENPSDATTLTGRTLLWIESSEMILARPTVGYGILSFRNYAPQNWEIRTVHGHNEWVTQAFQLGLIGVVLTVIIYWSFYRHFRQVTDLYKKKLGISVLIFILIEGVASAEPVGLLFPLPLLVLLTIWSSADHLDMPAYARQVDFSGPMESKVI
jgi:exopolysaccharide production protein ExoQ